MEAKHLVKMVRGNEAQVSVPREKDALHAGLGRLGYEDSRVPLHEMKMLRELHLYCQYVAVVHDSPKA